MAIQSIGTTGAMAPPPVTPPPPVKAPHGVGEPKAGSQPEAQSSAMPVQQQNQNSREPLREQVEQAVAEMKKSVESLTANNLQFSIDDDTGKTLIRIVDRQTGEMIRQIPSEEIIALAKALDNMQGTLLRQKA